jgi:hypothetical protein
VHQNQGMAADDAVIVPVKPDWMRFEE